MSQATSIAWSLLFGGRSVLFQVLLYPQVNVQEQRHIRAEVNPSLPRSPQGTEEPCREEGSPCESSQETQAAIPGVTPPNERVSC